MRDKLPQRMRAIVDMAGYAKTVADIGCDHGIVSEALIEEKRASRVIACDISEKSLKKVIDLACNNHWSGHLDARCGDGLSVLEAGEADVIILAGMGGLLIRRILERSLGVAHSADRIVCVPHGNEYELRTFFYENRFLITEERLVKEDRHYYQIIKAQTGQEAIPNEFELLFGKKLLESKDPLVREYLMFRKNELEQIIKSAKLGRNTGEYIERLRKLSQKITEVLVCR